MGIDVRPRLDLSYWEEGMDEKVRENQWVRSWRKKWGAYLGGDVACGAEGTDEWLQVLWVLVEAERLATIQAGMARLC